MVVPSRSSRALENRQPAPYTTLGPSCGGIPSAIPSLLEQCGSVGQRLAVRVA